MKQNKKTLKIKNKKLILELGDDYGEALKDMTTGVVGDVAKFAVDSAKFWGNMGKFMWKNSWYTFRAKILNNMSQEDYERALKTARVNFVDDTENNMRSIDSNVSQMLSKAGISDSEINSYLLGLPGYNIIENINATNILTGRAFDKLDDKKISALKHETTKLMVFYMYYDIEPALHKDAGDATDVMIQRVIRERRQDILTIEKKLIILLNTKLGKKWSDIFKYLRKKKSAKVMKVLEKCNTGIGRTHNYDKIKNENKANTFFAHAKQVFNSIKSLKESDEISSAASLIMSEKSLKLIKEYREEYDQDTWNTNFKLLIRSIARAILLVDEDIRNLVLKKYKESIAKAIEDVEKEREDENQKSGKSDKLKGLDRLEKLEKFVCNAGFEVNYYAAEVNYLNRLITEDSDALNSSKDFNAKKLAAYKQVMGSGGQVEIFDSIKQEITDFVNGSMGNSSSFDKEFKKINAAKERKEQRFVGQKELLAKYKEAFKVKKDIHILNYVLIEKDTLDKNYDKAGVEKFKKYATDVLNNKINADYIPDNIKKILQALSNYAVSDIKKSIAELENDLNSAKSTAEQKSKDLDVEIKALEAKIQSGTSKSGSGGGGKKGATGTTGTSGGNS